MLRHTGMAEQVDAADSKSVALGREGSTPSPGTKTCSRCQKTQPVTRFSKRRTRKDGSVAYQSTCKMCQSDYFKEYRLRNADRLREQGKKYRETSAGKRSEYSREYYRSVRADPVLAEARRRADTERKREWNRANPDRVRESQRRYRENLRKDPERWEHHLAMRRTRQAASRRHRAGNAGPVVGGFIDEAKEMVDASAFIEWVQAQRASGRSFEMLADGSGVSPRALRRVMEQGRVTLDVLDRVLMHNDVMLWELGY